MTRGKNIRNFAENKRIFFIVRNVDRGAVAGRKVAPLQKEFHDQIGTIITPIFTDMVNGCDVVIETVSVIYQNIKTREIFAFVNIHDGRIAHQMEVRPAVERLCVFFMQGGLRLLETNSVVIAGCKNNLDMGWHAFEVAGKLVVLLVNIFDNEFLLLQRVHTDAINNITNNKKILDFFCNFAVLGASEPAIQPEKKSFKFFRKKLLAPHMNV